MWEVNVTDEFEAWYEGLSLEDQTPIRKAVAALEEHGPNLKRPTVGEVKGARTSHLKELRPPSSTIRILFAFDPRRQAVLLLGGDKSRQWNAWYRSAIPHADDLYDEYLQELRDEQLIE
jgi:hypothetical protein